MSLHKDGFRAYVMDEMRFNFLETKSARFEGSCGNTSDGEIFACGGIESFHKEQSGSSFLLRGPETFYVIKLDRFRAGSKGCSLREFNCARSRMCTNQACSSLYLCVVLFKNKIKKRTKSAR
jgi:hypothetical protein